MSKLFYKCLIFCIVLISGNNVYGQDPVFSQYYASSLFLNPAMGGMEPLITVGVNSRMQWASVAEPFETHQVSATYPLYETLLEERRHAGGVGLSVYTNKAGITQLQTTGASANFSYNLYLDSSNVVTVGAQGGIVQRSINRENFKWGSQFDPITGYNPGIDPNVSNIVGQTIYPDVSAGFIYSFNRKQNFSQYKWSGYLGGAFYHLNTPDESLFKNIIRPLAVFYKFHGGAVFPIAPQMTLSPNALVALHEHVAQYNAGLYYNYDFTPATKGFVPGSVTFGVWHRLQDAFIFMIGFGNDSYDLGFSYDYNSSTLQDFTSGNGAYEISLKLHFPVPQKEEETKKKPKRFHTPRM